MIFRTATVFVIVAWLNQFAAAQGIPLTIDSSQSSIEITISGSSDTSVLSGDSRIDLTPPSEPFGTARITELNMVLDDGFSFSLLGGLVSANAAPGNVSLEMITAGAAGAVDGSNLFDQLMNEAEFAGDVEVFDPLGLAGGTRTIDLSTLDPEMFDMIDVQLSVVGSTLTVTVNFSVSVPLDGGLTLDADGTVVSTGEMPVLISVVPDSLMAARGVLVTGVPSDLAESDNVDVVMRRNPNGTVSVTELDIKGTSSVAVPTILQFTLEAAVFARTPVTQEIRLFNYDTDDYEVVDSRAANRFTDIVTTVSPTGDVSRFVQPGTGCIEAKIVFTSTNPRQNFSANMDQTIWTIGD